MKNNLLVIVLLFSITMFTGTATAQQAPAIGKEKAIEIAKRNGYYKPKSPWQVDVSLDSERNTWIITSMKNKVIRTGKCAETNGCTKLTTRRIFIDAVSGKVLERQINRGKKVPNYE